ncbi:MAG: tetratricopeptide repeat protein [Bacteroidales bacterium]|nr:tetratricopeptide repeat protein [Bacteroidales bacterium]
MGVSLKKSLKAMLFLAFLGIAPVIYGQTSINDVKASFNQAVQMEKINPEAAINSYETVIQLADEVGGEEAEQIKSQALSRIPKMHYELAKKLAGAKDYEGSVKMLDASIEGFNKIGDSRSASRSVGTILSIRNVQGSAAMNEGNYTEALAFYDDALQRDPGYTKGYLGKLLIYDKMEDIDKMEETAIMGLQVCQQENDNRTAGDINKVMSTYFFNDAQTAMAGKEYAKAESNLKSTIEYGNNNVIVHYQLGLAQKFQEKWNDAVASFSKALELEMEGPEDKAKIYFGLGESYQALGQNAQACTAYKNAYYGEFAEAAKYQVENVLECDK